MIHFWHAQSLSPSCIVYMPTHFGCKTPDFSLALNKFVSTWVVLTTPLHFQ